MARPDPRTHALDPWTSPSELKDWRQCRRRWAFQWINKAQQRDTAITLLGRELHDIASDYLEEGLRPDLELRRSWAWTGDATTFLPGRILEAMLPLLPVPGTGEVEAEGFLELLGREEEISGEENA